MRVRGNIEACGRDVPISDVCMKWEMRECFD